MKVRKGQVLVFNAAGWDRFDARANTPADGTVVRVCAPPGCPGPNVMGHCFVETLDGSVHRAGVYRFTQQRSYQVTRAMAEYLAKTEKDYRARKLRGQWVVWCDTSDHIVEFDDIVLTFAAGITDFAASIKKGN